MTFIFVTRQCKIMNYRNILLSYYILWFMFIYFFLSELSQTHFNVLKTFKTLSDDFNINVLKKKSKVFRIDVSLLKHKKPINFDKFNNVISSIIDKTFSPRGFSYNKVLSSVDEPYDIFLHWLGQWTIIGPTVILIFIVFCSLCSRFQKYLISMFTNL